MQLSIARSLNASKARLFARTTKQSTMRVEGDFSDFVDLILVRFVTGLRPRIPSLESGASATQALGIPGPDSVSGQRFRLRIVSQIGSDSASEWLLPSVKVDARP